MRWILGAAWSLLAVTLSAAQAGPGAAPQAAADPVAVFETVKGTFEIQWLAKVAPKSVEHVVALVRKGFYRAQRFHRVTETLAQIGDIASRDYTKREWWGRTGVQNPIGVAEISKTLKHERGSVGLAHSGTPAYADSQFYIMKLPSASLDGKYAIVGRVVRGMEIVDKLKVEDQVKDVYIKGEGRK